MSPLRTNIEVVHPVIEVDGSIETPSLHVQNHVWRLYSLKKIIYTFTQMNGDHIIMNWLSEEEHGPWPQEECPIVQWIGGELWKGFPLQWVQRGIEDRQTHSHTQEEDKTYRHLCLDVEDHCSFTLDPVKPAAGGTIA